jgi:hypothetical protein
VYLVILTVPLRFNKPDNMKKKKAAIIFPALVILFFASILYRNVTTYNSMKKYSGYTFGTIIKVWDDDGSGYSRYQYTVNGKTFQGRQGKKCALADTVLIVYDTTKPRFSMIADYSSPIRLDSSHKIVGLDTALVRYRWLDYLPGDEIHSIKDLWSLD